MCGLSQRRSSHTPILLALFRSEWHLMQISLILNGGVVEEMWLNIQCLALEMAKFVVRNCQLLPFATGVKILSVLQRLP